MKTKLPILIAALFIVLPMATVSAQMPRVDPATGLPLPIPPAVDPATGLPADGSPPFKDNNGTPTWIDPTWVDPGKVLPSVEWQELPVSEVAHVLQEQFTNAFDIILPGDGGFDPTQISVQLRLKNVTATEIFNAMNLQFELEKSPYRWELMYNGMRPTAIIRDIPQLVAPAPAAPPPQPQIRKVFFVGDMLVAYPGANDTAKLADISDFITQAWDKTGISQGGKVDVYPSGELLIVSGTPEQVDLAVQTLSALKEKAAFDSMRPKK